MILFVYAVTSRLQTRFVYYNWVWLCGKVGIFKAASISKLWLWIMCLLCTTFFQWQYTHTSISNAFNSWYCEIVVELTEANKKDNIISQ